MVRGLDKFKEHFRGYEASYVLIGGTSSSLVMEEVGLLFRATVDLDIVLCVEEIMDDMQHLHYVLSVKKGSRKPVRRIETPSKTQSEVLSAFGYYVDESGVLQGPAD